MREFKTQQFAKFYIKDLKTKLQKNNTNKNDPDRLILSSVN